MTQNLTILVNQNTKDQETMILRIKEDNYE
jgi:hypothetical protein